EVSYRRRRGPDRRGQLRRPRRTGGWLAPGRLWLGRPWLGRPAPSSRWRRRRGWRDRRPGARGAGGRCGQCLCGAPAAAGLLCAAASGGLCAAAAGLLRAAAGLLRAAPAGGLAPRLCLV
ncbi:MAG: hypothetical protein AVDCRST_MAG27-917, partial [uncultured Craurococcus sp.]